MKERDASAGFRRVLYDAMVLSASLRAIRCCDYYRRWRTDKVDGYVEAHQASALVQTRSMIDFLNCVGRIEGDTMLAVQFFGCSQQSIPFDMRKAANKYAATRVGMPLRKTLPRVQGSRASQRLCLLVSRFSMDS